MSADTIARLEISRKELLDLGMRNPLLNHRKRAKQIAVVDELSAETFRILVTSGRTMSFDALPDKKVEELAEREAEEGGTTDAVNWEDLLAQPDEDLSEGQLAGRHTDNKLQTTLVSEKLQTRLLSIHNDARTYLEEQGVNILYLALGFLYWYESPSANEPRRAPLLLVPVALERASARERFRLVYTGEDVGDNLSLREKLKAEFNLDLPQIDSSEELDVNAYMAAVADAVKGDERWHVEENEMTAGFFSFGKFLMYKDLDAQSWLEDARGEGFSILDSLLTDGFSEPDSAFGEETHIDEVISPADVHQVKDADSTQILAILDVNDGRNLVLQGPPGTGKSQTITNIIAECIGNGKKVLFVSEKMAALDVVKRRLDEVGLGDAVLELHSHKTNKKQVLAELDRTLHQGRPVVDSPEDNVEVLTRFRDELNTYCDAVNTWIGSTRTSFVNALGFALQNRIDDTDLQPFPFAGMEQWTEADFRAARLEVDKLDRHLAEAGAPSRNIFKASKLTEFLPSQRSRLEALLDKGKIATRNLQAGSADLSQEMGFAPPVQRKEAEIICRAARRAMEAPHLEGLALSSGDWQQRKDDLDSLIAAGRALSEAHARYDELLIDEAWQQDLLDVRQQYVTKGTKWWRFLSGEFRRAKNRLQGLSRKPLQKNVGEIIEMIDTVLDSQKHRQEYNRSAELGSALFGAQWKKTDSDWDVLETLTDWVVKLYRDVGDGIVPEGIVNFLSGSPKLDAIREQVAQVEEQLENHQASMDEVAGLLKLKLKEGANADWDLTLEKQGKVLDHWKSNIDSLFHLVRFNQLAHELSQKGLGFVIPVARDWAQSEGVLLKLFDYSWYNGLVEKAYVETPAIKMFDRSHHAHILEEFTRLDHLLFHHNQVRLAAQHWKALPTMGGGGELQIISREINKKRKHLPIRRLMSEAGRAIQAIKPVFMMSPMSIATYIPPGSVQFDLVVFDEASQVKPVDAFGAIIRGNQAVVVGDSKQLPPTSFFDSLVDSSDEDDFESVADMESILSLFLGKGAPERMLRWHYRSRHDSLIAVSNYEFYDSRLVVFPSPGANPSARGLRLHHLPDTAYDRGKTRSNPAEARAVALAVLEHAKTQPDLTLGVVAFSTAQRDAIELQLELLRRENPTYEPFFNENEREPFFIKNLENVQGDERDAIFISIGYGKTAEGYMAMSFGPLNRDGGERRLNVLISRARLAMDVFSNFTDDDIDLNRTNARGVAALKNFLAYAKTGILQQPYSTGKEPDSPFEEAVIDALSRHGIEIEPQVGSAGFFIDIAVKDPENPGRYLLGIECDGATYHSSRSARDRDRLREEVLEGLGWHLHRIWSTEWYRNPEKELERALAAIEKAKLDSLSRVPAATKKVPVKAVKEIVRDDSARRDNGQDALSVPYQKAYLYINTGYQELHELPESELLTSIIQVVSEESPIHVTELTRRIADGAGLKRAGSRIQAAVKSAIGLGLRGQKLKLIGDFIWDAAMTEAPVRDRSELEAGSKKIEFVADEEIQEALRLAVETGFSLNKADAISSAARLLGFQRVTAQAEKRFRDQLESMIARNRLELRGGMVVLPVS